MVEQETVNFKVVGPTPTEAAKEFVSSPKTFKMRVYLNGRESVFQTDYVGPIPSTRSKKLLMENNLIPIPISEPKLRRLGTRQGM